MNLYGYLSVLFIGDVVGTAAVDFLGESMPAMISQYAPDVIIINGENAHEGKGLDETDQQKFFGMGAHVVTTGNHVWENWKSKPILKSDPKVIRPYNYPDGNIGNGFYIVKISDELQVAVVQLQGRTFMQAIDCPFRTGLELVKELQLTTKNIVIDFHAEASAEKMALGWHLDGKVSAILGTHTHIQTADAQILKRGTAFITDVGMTGPYNSVVGLRKDIAIKRAILQTAHKYELGVGDLKVSGCNVIINPNNGKALEINSFVFPEFRTKEESNHE
ncbi:MAG: TIGR00282 family metallophosphoesterase [Candidatus Kapabacteria bacterium]|nr:TIGR00282 family metallophosphoesterase [Candidatus Kapabacteria bacterium]